MLHSSPCAPDQRRVVLEISLLTRGDTRSCPFAHAKNTKKLQGEGRGA